MKITIKDFASKDTNVVIPIFIDRPHFGYEKIYSCPKLLKLLNALKSNRKELGLYLINYPFKISKTIEAFIESVNMDYHTEDAVNYLKDIIYDKMKKSQGLLIEGASDGLIDIQDVIPDAKPVKEWLYIDLNSLKDPEPKPVEPTIICSLHGIGLDSGMKKRKLNI